MEYNIEKKTMKNGQNKQINIGKTEIKQKNILEKRTKTTKDVV